MAELPITTVVNVSVSKQPAGLGFYNVNTLVIFTDDKPVNELTSDYLIAYDARTVETAFGSAAEVTEQAQMIFGQSPNILTGGGVLLVCPFTSTSETLAQAISRLAGLTYFCGILTTRNLQKAEAEAAATAVQSMQNAILLLSSGDASVFTKDTGLFYTINKKAQYFTKCLYYGMGADADTKAKNARLFAACYAGRAFAQNFDGSNTSQTMNLKDLSGIVADTSIDTTLLQQCDDLGVDIYPSIAGLPKVKSFANSLYFDQIYQQIWFVLNLQVNVFNALATTRTKIPQTEAGMNVLKGACKQSCNQAVTIGYFAPGEWKSSDTFGNPDDFKRNIRDVGYFIYSQPIAEQAQADRVERKAPLIQISGKESGAVHSAEILVYLES